MMLVMNISEIQKNEFLAEAVGLQQDAVAFSSGRVFQPGTRRAAFLLDWPHVRDSMLGSDTAERGRSQAASEVELVAAHAWLLMGGQAAFAPLGTAMGTKISWCRARSIQQVGEAGR